MKRADSVNDPALDRPDEWIASGGGPLIVLPESALAYWNGVDEPGTGIIPVAEGTPSDYDRACSMTDLVGVVPVGPGEGLVLGDEPLDTRWWRPHRAGSMYLIRWVYGDSTRSVIQTLSELDRLSLEPTGVLFNTNSKRLVLFDSAMPGTDILTPYSSTELAPGAYTIGIDYFEPNPRTKVSVLRLSPAALA
jgi:hypothetical protein